MHKIRPGMLTAEIVKNNLKGIIERFVGSDNAFSFMTSVKGTPSYWKQILYDVLAMIKQLGIPTYFLILSCADLRWEELPYIINKLSNLGLSDEELKNLNYQEFYNLLNNNPVLVARHFQYKVEIFFKEIILDGPLGKRKIVLYVLNFKKGIAHMFIRLYGFSIDQIFKIKLPTLSLLRKE